MTGRKDHEDELFADAHGVELVSVEGPDEDPPGTCSYCHTPMTLHTITDIGACFAGAIAESINEN